MKPSPPSSSKVALNELALAHLMEISTLVASGTQYTLLRRTCGYETVPEGEMRLALLAPGGDVTGSAAVNEDGIVKVFITDCRVEEVNVVELL
eukprot:1535811-Rhodomonas_salina.1